MTDTKKSADPFARETGRATLKEMRAKLAEEPEAAKVFREEIDRRWLKIPAEQRAFVCKMAKREDCAERKYSEIAGPDRAAIRGAVARLRRVVDNFDYALKQG